MAKFTEEEDVFIKANYLTLTSYDIAKFLKRTSGTIRQRYKLLELVVPPDILEKFRTKTHFKKGQVPVTKGLRQTEYMSPEAIERSKAGRFKPGNISHTAKSDGAITERTERNGRTYKWIRLAENKWQMLHVYLWEQKNGVVPKGFKLRFIDGNSLNCVVENLRIAVSKNNLDKFIKIHNETTQAQKKQETLVAKVWKEIEAEEKAKQRRIRDLEQAAIREQKRIIKLQKQKAEAAKKITSAIRTYAPHTARRQEDKKYVNLQTDFSSLVGFRVDSKTFIYIKPNQNPEEEKAKYLQNRIVATQGNPFHKQA